MKNLLLTILCLTLHSCTNSPPRTTIVPYVEIREDSLLFYQNALKCQQDSLKDSYRQLRREVRRVNPTP